MVITGIIAGLGLLFIVGNFIINLLGQVRELNKDNRQLLKDIQQLERPATNPQPPAANNPEAKPVSDTQPPVVR